MVLTAIRVGDLRRAEERLEVLERRFPRRNAHVRIGLRCELLIAAAEPPNYELQSRRTSPMRHALSLIWNPLAGDLDNV
jgi:hypothetical protein